MTATMTMTTPESLSSSFKIKDQEQAPSSPSLPSPSNANVFDGLTTMDEDVVSLSGSAESPASGTVVSSQNDTSSKGGTSGGGSSSGGGNPGGNDNVDTAIAANENRNVFRLRLMVLFFLLLSTIGVAVGVHRYVSHSEQSEFEAKFEDDSEKVLEAIGSTLANTLGSADSFLVGLVSHARESNSTWPFVTYPDYAVHLAKLRSLSKAVLVSQYHFVTAEERAAWEAYSVANDAWVQDGIDTQRQDRSYEGKIVDDFWTRGEIHESQENYTAPGPYLPKWQQSPVVPIYAPYNWDAATLPSLATVLPVLMDDRNIAMGDVSNIAVNSDAESLRQEAGNNMFIKDFLGPQEVESEPFSEIYFPILDYMADYVTIPKDGTDPKSLGNFVGVFAMTFFWRDLMKNILPADSTGIVVVFRNTCGQSFTYQVDGPDTLYLGRDDVHETKYDDYLVRSIDLTQLAAFTSTINDRSYTGLDLSKKGCQYHLSVYPSTEMEDEVKSNDPIIFTVVAISIFLFTSLIFICYDYMVERRQAKVMETAVHTSAIVSSLFPSNVRDRLFNTDKNKSSADAKKAFEHNKTRLKTFLSSDGKQTDPRYQSDSKEQSSGPIADLFPHCTVQFCDISGFTAWSSVREPSQVFLLLESLYGAFDQIAMKRNVFKVETIGDAYVAVCGLPEPRDDHHIVMAKFARDCLLKAGEIFRGLETTLGPGTGDLRLRFGLHSGAVTAGVLRGQKSRFQLFGDTVNTAARMESTGQPNKVQVSEATADLIRSSKKESWLKSRDEMVEAKGKGTMKTYWLDLRAMSSSNAVVASSSDGDGDRSALDEKTKRLVDWNHDILSRLLRNIVGSRKATGRPGVRKGSLGHPITSHGSVIDEVCEVIDLPDYNSDMYMRQRDPDDIILDDVVNDQLRDYIVAVAAHYNENSFHCFDHASHVGMSTAKLLSRIVRPEEVLTSKSMSSNPVEIGRVLHDHTFGITSDPLTQFACVFSALIHDVDHPGVPNTCLVKEQTPMAVQYHGKSVAEQHSVDVAWNLLMTDPYKELRAAICQTPQEMERFRQLVVNIVMATDIMDKDLITARNCRWEKAFADVIPKGSASGGAASERDNRNRKATIVLEHLIQASDVAHTMQHWHIYQKWNERLFRELYAAYRAGRSDTNPADFWYEAEIGFLSKYVIPLAKKLKECGVFGVSSDEYLTYAEKNLAEWEVRGKDVVAAMLVKERKHDLKA